MCDISYVFYILFQINLFKNNFLNRMEQDKNEKIINENSDRDRSASLLDYFLLRRGRKSVFKSKFYDRQI